MTSETKGLNDNAGDETEESKISDLVVDLKILLAQKYKKLLLPPDGDKFLERCLRHRKLNLTQAADQVSSFYKLFSGLNKVEKRNLFVPSQQKTYFFDSLSMNVLKQRDESGSPIIFVDYETMPGETFNCGDYLAVVVMVFNELISLSEEMQNLGVVVFVNLKGLQFAHTRQFTLSRLRTAAALMQGSLPVSFKAVHCINVPTIALYVFALFKPMLRPKIRDRIYMYGQDYEEIYKVVDKSLLPIPLGGDLPTEEAVDNDFVKNLCEKDEYYKDFLRYGYPSLDDKDS